MSKNNNNGKNKNSKHELLQKNKSKITLLKINTSTKSNQFKKEKKTNIYKTSGSNENGFETPFQKMEQGKNASMKKESKMTKQRINEFYERQNEWLAKIKKKQQISNQNSTKNQRLRLNQK